MGVMKDISIMIDNTMEHIYDDLKFDSAYFKMVFVSGLIERLETERKKLVDAFVEGAENG